MSWEGWIRCHGGGAVAGAGVGKGEGRVLRSGWRSQHCTANESNGHCLLFHAEETTMFL